MPKRPRGGKNPPGYEARVRRGKRHVAAYLEPSLFDAVHEILSRDGITLQAILEKFCHAYVRSNGKLPDLSRR